MDFAAENGHLDVVKWLHHNRSEGCTDDAAVMAARNGHSDIEEWLDLNRSENHATIFFHLQHFDVDLYHRGSDTLPGFSPL